MVASTPEPTPVNQQNLGSLWMLAAALCFAVMGAFVKYCGDYYSSAELVFYRSLFGLLLISAYALWRNLSIRTPLIKKQITRSTYGFISMVMFFYALSHLPLASAITLNYTSPLAMATILTISHHEKPRPMLIAALVMGFAGVVLLLRPSLHMDELLAGGLGLLSGILAGLVYVHVMQLGRAHEPDWRTVFYFSLTCSLGGGLWMLIHEYHPLRSEDILPLLSLGAFATMGQLTMTRAYRTGNPFVVGSLAYTTVVIASLIAYLVWQETMSTQSWLAIGGIIFAGLISVYSNTHPKK
jgi:drug/metabolite transporter (DMT)-like permease